MGVINSFAEVIACIIDVFILEHFLYIYFGPKRNNTIWMRSAIYILLFLASYFLNDYVYLQGFALILLLFIYARLGLKGKWQEQLLACCIEFIVTLLLCLIIIQIVMLMFRSTKEQMLFEDSTQRFVLLCINRLVFIFSFYFLVNIFKKEHSLKRNEWLLSLIYFISSSIISLLLLMWTAYGNNTFCEQVIVCVITTLLILTTIISLYLIYHLSEKNNIDTQNHVLKSQIEMEKGTIRNLQREYSRVKIMRHDMNKQLNIYLQLLIEGNVEKTIEVLKEQINTDITTDFIYIKGNDLISAVLSEKKEICKKNDISFHFDVSAVVVRSQEMDVAIMLSNLLDNAIESELKQENREVVIQIFELKSMLNIIVKNRIKESVLVENPNLNTNKENKEVHGYGLKSIQSTVDQLNGMIQCFEDQNEFIVHISLMQNPA